MASKRESLRELILRWPRRKKFHAEERVPSELCTLLVARAFSGGRPAQSNAGSVSRPPDPAIEDISPAKKATKTKMI